MEIIPTIMITIRNLRRLEDVLHPPEVPEGYHDGWGHLDWTGFCLRFPKIYNTWGVKWKKVVRNLPVLGGRPPSSWGSWWWSWWLESSSLNLIFLGFPKICNCGVEWKMVVRNLPILGGHPPSSWGSWWWLWWLRSSSLNLKLVLMLMLMLSWCWVEK